MGRGKEKYDWKQRVERPELASAKKTEWQASLPFNKSHRLCSL